MAKRRTPNAIAIDPKKTICPEQAFAISYDENKGQYILDYYIFDASDYFEKKRPFSLLKKTVDRFDKEHDPDYWDVFDPMIKQISNYTGIYRRNKKKPFGCKALKERKFKALKIKTIFDEQGRFIDARGEMCSKVNIDFLETELIQKRVFQKEMVLSKKSQEINKHTEMLKIAKDFSEKIVKNTEIRSARDMMWAIDYAASQGTAHIAIKKKIPFLYRAADHLNSNVKTSIHNLSTAPQTNSVGRPIAYMSAPLRNFDHGINLTQMTRKFKGEPLLSKETVEHVKEIINERKYRIYEQKDDLTKTVEEMKEYGFIELLSLRNVQENVFGKVDEKLEEEINRRDGEYEINKLLTDSIHLFLNHIERKPEKEHLFEKVISLSDELTKIAKKEDAKKKTKFRKITTGLFN